MYKTIKEIRETTGMSQKAFAGMYGISVSTLRNWEQGANTPAPYVVNLIARTLPSMNAALTEIPGRSGRSYYYDEYQNCVLDVAGNRIFVKEKLGEVKAHNLSLYLDDLFDEFYAIRDRFDRDCKYDQEEDILWS